MQAQAFFPYLHKDNTSRQLFTLRKNKSPTCIIQCERLPSAMTRRLREAEWLV